MLHAIKNKIPQYKYICISHIVRRKSDKNYIGKFNPEYKIYEEDLPEYVYAGKNLKPHTRVYAMGISSHGGLGIKSLLRPKDKRLRQIAYMHRPHRILFAEVNDISDIACGYGYTVFAVKPNKHLLSCFGTGLTTNGQIGKHMPRIGHLLEVVIEPAPIDIPLNENSIVNKVACGRAHTVVSTNDNDVWTFGDNAYGQCGRPVIEKEDYRNTYYHLIDSFKGKSIEQIECGQDTSFILSNGIVFSCGLSADGQTGRGLDSVMDSFAQVVGDLKGEKIIKISCRGDCVLALNDKGEVFGWGNSEYGQFDCVSDKEQISTPTYLSLKLPRVIDVAASGSSCYAVTEEGEVYSWGYGALGRGPDETGSKEPKLIPSTLLGRNILNKDSKVTKIFAGVAMVAAITSEGSLYTWGKNTGGCLGHGDTKMKYFPLRVCIAGFVKKVSCGVDHMMAMARSLL